MSMPKIVPIVEFSDIHKMTDAEKQTIRRKGCLVVRNVIDDEEVAGWRAELQEYVKINPVAGQYHSGSSSVH